MTKGLWCKLPPVHYSTLQFQHPQLKQQNCEYNFVNLIGPHWESNSAPLQRRCSTYLFGLTKQSFGGEFLKHLLNIRGYLSTVINK